MKDFFLSNPENFNEEGQRVYHLPQDVDEYFDEVISPDGLGEMYIVPEMEVYMSGEDGVTVDTDYFTYVKGETGQDEVLPLCGTGDYKQKENFVDLVCGWGELDDTDGSYVIIFD